MSRRYSFLGGDWLFKVEIEVEIDSPSWRFQLQVRNTVSWVEICHSMWRLGWRLTGQLEIPVASRRYSFSGGDWPFKMEIGVEIDSLSWRLQLQVRDTVSQVEIGHSKWRLRWRLTVPAGDSSCKSEILFLRWRLAIQSTDCCGD